MNQAKGPTIDGRALGAAPTLCHVIKLFFSRPALFLQAMHGDSIDFLLHNPGKLIMT
jgi:hypothetical protein